MVHIAIGLHRTVNRQQARAENRGALLFEQPRPYNSIHKSGFVLQDQENGAAGSG